MVGFGLFFWAGCDLALVREVRETTPHERRNRPNRDYFLAPPGLEVSAQAAKLQFEVAGRKNRLVIQDLVAPPLS
ncbi:MAG: hypothetical protein RJB38_2048 [Pseudomonadota bacterium]